MTSKILEANRLRMLLRMIPRSASFSVEDCRYLEKRKSLELQGPSAKNQFFLYFIKRDTERKVLLLGDSMVHKELLGREEEILAIHLAFIMNEEKKKRAENLIFSDFRGPLLDLEGPMDWYEEQFSFLYHEHLDSLGEFRRGLCSSLVHVILSRMILNTGEMARPSYSRSDLIRICQMIKNHPEKRFSLHELALAAGLSPRHFARVFSRTMGITPKAYEIKQRMAYARYLLQQRGYNVKETAMKCGYSDPFLFSRQFKKLYGSAPGKQINSRSPL